jgi:hypothetical protein
MVSNVSNAIVSICKECQKKLIVSKLTENYDHEMNCPTCGVVAEDASSRIAKKKQFKHFQSIDLKVFNQNPMGWLSSNDQRRISPLS